jgi:Lon protease-like protein
MICPFTASEKQALLEAKDATHRAKLLIALIEMSALADEDGARH